MLGTWHREDVKAVLRRRYGSVFAFEEAKGLPRTSVSDVLRGRKIERTARAILEELSKPEYRASHSGPAGGQSDKSDDTT